MQDHTGTILNEAGLDMAIVNPKQVTPYAEIPAAQRAVAEDLLTVDFAEELGRVQTPTLIVWGAQDTFCPRADQDGLVEAIADAQLVVYARAGHAVHWEEPERFAADLTDFVQRLAR